MIGIEDLEFGWFAAFMLLLIGYAILDGFDLGVGMLHLCTKDNEERRIMLNSIGPVWDGNEVWLVTAGGALFAGFPDIYATMMSSFYLPIMTLLAGLIFRAVAIEFRSKENMRWWRLIWDITFFCGSAMIAFILGLVLGNLIYGIPLSEQKEFTGDLSAIFHPYTILIGFFANALFILHGSTYLLMKTEGVLHDKIRAWTNHTLIIFVIMYAISTLSTIIYMPHMIEALRERPFFFLIAIVNILVVANIHRTIRLKKDGWAFISSCANIICLLVLYAIGTYPNVIRSIDEPDRLSLTIYNSASSSLTLRILFTFALIGLPLVISYTTAIYYIFRGKVKIDPHSY